MESFKKLLQSMNTASIIDTNTCNGCGNNDPSNIHPYYTHTGYSAKVCKLCGSYYDHSGYHPADDWSIGIVNLKNKFITMPAITNLNKEHLQAIWSQLDTMLHYEERIFLMMFPQEENWYNSLDLNEKTSCAKFLNRGATQPWRNSLLYTLIQLKYATL